MTAPLPWQLRIGQQRDWVWRGWQTRYTYLHPEPAAKTPPLILLHGFGASIGHWRHNLAVLGKDHSVYALDMLGFGASEKAFAPYTIHLWVEQVYDFWRTFIQQPVVLVGNSIGSLVCLAAAMAHPEMIQATVMISLPDPSVREAMLPGLVRPLVTAVERALTTPPLLRSLFYLVRHPRIVRPWAAIAYATPTPVTDELVEILVGPAHDQGSAGAFCAILKAMIDPQFGPNVKAVLPQLQIPMLLIWGQQDRMIPPHLGREFARYNPNLKLLEIENAGHCAHDECPEQVNAAILSWIQSWYQDTAQEDVPPDQAIEHF